MTACIGSRGVRPLANRITDRTPDILACHLNPPAPFRQPSLSAKCRYRRYCTVEALDGLSFSRKLGSITRYAHSLFGCLRGQPARTAHFCCQAGRIPLSIYLTENAHEIPSTRLQVISRIRRTIMKTPQKSP